MTWVQVIKENKIKLKLVFEVLLVYEIFLKRAELTNTVDWGSASLSNAGTYSLTQSDWNSHYGG